jgi:hypothetical protein
MEWEFGAINFYVNARPYAQYTFLEASPSSIYKKNPEVYLVRIYPAERTGINWGF